jgi:hypothetical protein
LIHGPKKTPFRFPNELVAASFFKKALRRERKEALFPASILSYPLSLFGEALPFTY